MIYVFLVLFTFILGFSIYTSKYNDPYRHIYFVMGLPGCGKTTYFVNRMLYYKKQNEKLRKKGLPEWSIYSDTPVNIPGVRIFNPEHLKDSWPDPKSVLFIDEITLYWDSRKFASFDAGITQFFKLHRHAECIVYCASQNFDCDKRIRDLTNHFMIMFNLANCITWVRPVKVIFPIFTQADSNKGSDITSGYEYNKFWKWRFYWMPSSWKYFNTKSLPPRRPLPYTLSVDDSGNIDFTLNDGSSELNSKTIVLSKV